MAYIMSQKTFQFVWRLELIDMPYGNRYTQNNKIITAFDFNSLHRVVVPAFHRNLRMISLSVSLF